MQTDKVRLINDETGRKEAMEQVEKFSDYVGLSKRDTMKLRLLTEETLGMVATITGGFTADFFIESTEDSRCRLHLIANTTMDSAKKEELIAASSSKKNAASRGVMGKIRDIIENSLYSVDDVGRLQAQYGTSTLMYGTMGMIDTEAMNAGAAAYAWSLNRYRDSLITEKDGKEGLDEAWDELEKSIVANIADDVSVSVKGDVVHMIIEKKISRS